MLAFARRDVNSHRRLNGLCNVFDLTACPLPFYSSVQSAGASRQYDGWQHNGSSFVQSGSMVLLTAIAEWE